VRTHSCDARSIRRVAARTYISSRDGIDARRTRNP
jgi:hypothetical protein